MKKLYTYHNDDVSYKSLPKRDCIIYHLSRFIVASVPFVAAAIGIFTVVMFALRTTDRAAYEIDIKTIQSRCDATVDSISTELAIEHCIARYFVDAHVSKPTADSVRAVAVAAGAWYPDIIVAQFIIESGSGTSDLARSAHNLFGMKKVAGKRLSYTTQEKHSSHNGYGTYKNWELSVIDRVMYERHHFGGTKPTRETYIRMLDIYAEDPAYKEKIDSLCKKH